MRKYAVVLTIAMVPLLGHAQEAEQSREAQDRDYVARFEEQFPKVESPPALEEYATAARYDDRFLGESLDAALVKISNDTGGIAWGLSARMASLNDMYHATGDAKYLDANLRCIRAVLAVRDDKRGVALWTGTTVPAWSSTKYAKRGRAVFAVHTGVITVPMFDLLLAANENVQFRESLGAEYDEILAQAKEALAVHDRQWRDGPGEGEGHYIGLDQEEVCENKPLPGNRLSAMGWALWLSWKVSGDEVHRDRALATGRYIKRRLTLGADGAYYWPYWLPEDPVIEGEVDEDLEGEDVSHAGLTMSLPHALAMDGQVFTREDMARMVKTVQSGFGRLGEGMLISRVTGATDLRPSYVGEPARWLCLAEFDRAVCDPIVQFYLNYKPKPSPRGLALLVRYARQAE